MYEELAPKGDNDNGDDGDCILGFIIIFKTKINFSNTAKFRKTKRADERDVRYSEIPLQ